MDAHVQLVFLGEVHAGFHLDEVKRSLGQLLKLDEARLAQLFSGARTVLKRSLQAHEAQRYVEHLSKLGARVHIEPMPAVAVAAAPVVLPATALALSPTVAPSEEEIVCPTCGERQSKRILCRSCATNMPMGIAAKLEAEQEARATRQAMIDARRRPARGRSAEVEEVHETDPDAPTVWGFGLSGRLGRLPYATANTWLVTLLVVLTVHLLQRPSGGRLVLLGLGGIFFFLLSMRLAVLRCHDCDRHGWWSLFLLVPYAGTLASLVLSLMPGTRGDNDFGGLPRRGRWLWLLVALAALVLSFAWTARTAMALVEQTESESSEHDSFSESDELSELLPHPDAVNAFRNDYELSPRHKAFAASSGGSWGFETGMSSAQDAMRGALAACEARRQPYTPTCALINVDGLWAEQR
ncbi:DUF805 domain-containing protein [Piscinibacter sp.]|uniref:DUF805 domain-containing protein n=1 Tax=Piscinibacter sp. TaxID=1903157 RepID=UPI002B93EFCD|nr:DUF805 domain-containing protein [Albitalea sp.]HUG25221.1 DUF805 domain-containing protein [Albitalea sp.]